MLSSISWQQYFAAIAIISLSYYLYVVLRYYQREIVNLFSSKQQGTTFTNPVAFSAFDVMGRAREDQYVKIVDEQELQFADDGQEESTTSGDTTIITPQQQLFAETNNLIAAFEDVDSKSEFISLLNILVSSYEQYQAELDYSLLTAHLLSRSASGLPFELYPEDLSFKK